MTTQETLRQLRHIVNNLTPENFDELVKNVGNLNFDTGMKLREAVKLIFFKAVLEPSSKHQGQNTTNPNTTIMTKCLT